MFGSLGIAGVSDSFSNLLNSIFDKIVPFGFDSGYLILILFIGMLFHDFSTYVSHRLSHIFFWELHEFHHSATEMNIFNLYRASVLEVTLMALIVLPINLLPLSIMNKALAEGQWLVFITYLLAYNLVGQFFSYLGHSSVKIIFPKPISYLFLSPSLHWLHHSDNPDHYGKNFGSIFTIWDKAFGTYLDESHLKDIKSFGVKNSEYNKHHPLYSFYILPVIKLIKKYRN